MLTAIFSSNCSKYIINFEVDYSQSEMQRYFVPKDKHYTADLMNKHKN